MNSMGNLMEQMEAEMFKQFRTMTPDQRAEEERKRQIQRDWEAKHTAIETEEDRNDSTEYPDDPA